MVCHRKKTKSTLLAILLLTVDTKGMNPLLPLADTKSTRKEQYTINQLKYTCPDGFSNILTCLVNPSTNNHNVQEKINKTCRNLSPNKAITYVNLILILSKKSYFPIEELLNFMDEIRKKYNNHTNKHIAFFKVFSDAKANFYFLPCIQNKIMNDGCISEEEYNYLKKKKYLLKSYENTITVSVESKFNKYFKKFFPQNNETRLSALLLYSLGLAEYLLPDYIKNVDPTLIIAGLMLLPIQDVYNTLLYHYTKPKQCIIFLDSEQAIHSIENIENRN